MVFLVRRQGSECVRPVEPRAAGATVRSRVGWVDRDEGDRSPGNLLTKSALSG